MAVADTKHPENETAEDLPYMPYIVVCTRKSDGGRRFYGPFASEHEATMWTQPRAHRNYAWDYVRVPLVPPPGEEESAL